MISLLCFNSSCVDLNIEISISVMNIYISIQREQVDSSCAFPWFFVAFWSVLIKICSMYADSFKNTMCNYSLIFVLVTSNSRDFSLRLGEGLWHMWSGDYRQCYACKLTPFQEEHSFSSWQRGRILFPFLHSFNSRTYISVLNVSL